MRRMIALALGFGLALPGSALAATPSIVSPATNEVVIGAPSVNVRVPGDATAVQVSIDGVDVTKRLTRADGVLRGDPTGGEALSPGFHTLGVRVRSTGRWQSTVRQFAVARNHEPLLIMDRAVRTANAPIEAVIRAPHSARVTAQLNGNAISGTFRRSRPGKWIAFLGANDGVRTGTNRLVVTVSQSSLGRTDTDVREVVVSRSAPVVGAGRDASSSVHGTVRFDGRSSLAQCAGLDPAWQILSAPRGSAAVLEQNRTWRPKISPDRTGTYRIRLHVRGSCAGGSSTHASERDYPFASDTATLSVAPVDPPIGVPVRTLIGYDEDRNPVGGIVIGGTTVPRTIVDLPSFSRPVLEKGFAVLDRATRGVLASGTDDTFDARTVRAVVKGYADRDDVLVIVSSVPDQGDGTPAVRDLLADLGVALSPLDVSLLADGQPWTAIGIPGAPSGSGFINVGGELRDRRNWRPEDDFFCRSGNHDKCYPPEPTPRPDPCTFICAQAEPSTAHAGELTGYLTQNGVGYYGFAFQEAVPFRLGAPDDRSARASAMVGSNELTLPYPATGRFGGWNLVVLDAKSLILRRNDVFVTSTTDGPVEAQRAALVAALNQVKPGQLVMLHRDGTICDTWRQLRLAVTRVGGTGELLVDCASNAHYSLIGGIGVANATESFEDSLAGALMRSNDSRFAPATAGRAGRTSTELMEVAYGGSSAWPFAEGAGHLAADAWIASRLQLPQSRSVRDNYYLNYSLDWSTLYTKLSGLAYPGDGHGFTQDEFAELKGALEQEFAAVAQVKAYVANLQAPFTSGFSRYVDLLGVGKTVKDAIEPPAAEVDTGFLSVISGISFFLSKVADLTGNPAAGQGLAVLGQGMALVKTVAENKGASSILPERISLATDQLAAELVMRYSEARDEFRTVGRLVVSDHDKLMLVSGKVTGDPSWAFEPTNPLIELGLSKSARRWFYETLLPVGFKVWRLSGERNARNWSCDAYSPLAGEVLSMRPFKDATDTIQYTADDGFLYVIGRADGGISSENAGRSAPASLITPLLQPLDKDPGSSRLGMSWPDLLRVLPVETPRNGPQSDKDC